MPTASVFFNNERLTGIGLCTDSADAASKGYVDSVVTAIGAIPTKIQNAAGTIAATA